LHQELVGVVKKKMTERGYGFIHADDGRDYFFHCTDLQTGLEFDGIQEGQHVNFVIKKAAGSGKAGAAQNVRRHES